MDDLQIGIYVDSRDGQGIRAALEALRTNYITYKQAYYNNAEAIEAYSAHCVAEKFCQVLNDAMLCSERP